MRIYIYIYTLMYYSNRSAEILTIHQPVGHLGIQLPQSILTIKRDVAKATFEFEYFGMVQNPWKSAFMPI